MTGVSDCITPESSASVQLCKAVGGAPNVMQRILFASNEVSCTDVA